MPTQTVRVIDATQPQAIEAVRQFFRNYAAWLGVDGCFQNFDQEMASLPGQYGAPGGRLFLAEVDGQPVGCVGVRAFADGVCELKRLYVEPAFRSVGLGRDLTVAAIAAARQLGYRRMLLDTLPAMRIALKLYRELGFDDVPAYYPTPLEGTVSMALDLGKSGGAAGDRLALEHLFDYNRGWAKQMTQIDPEFFAKLSGQQAPEYLWIGCSDSRVPANQIVGLLPGEVFVHRNIANVVVHTDLNCLAVIQFAIDVLKVKHIMVVGHYGCGGVRAALLRQRVGLADNWLRHVQDVHVRHAAAVDAQADVQLRHDRLCELNVIEQVLNVCQTTVVRDAWERGQTLVVHGWIYALRDGLLRDLAFTVGAAAELEPRYREALAALDAPACAAAS